MFQLLQWFESEGIHTESIKIAELTHGCNGVVATQPIPSDQIVIKIPLHLCIFSEDLLKNHYQRYKKFYPHIFNINLNEDAEFNSLVLYILQQRDNEMSLHKPYFDYVKDPQNILSWTQEQVNTIMDENLKKTIQRMRVCNIFQRAIQKGLNYDQFLYAYQFVMTRCFGGDDHLQSPCLVPFGDMLNHHDKCQTKQKSLEQILCLLQLSKFKKTKKFIIFGEHGNSFLLCWYGFTYDNNIYDKLYLLYEDDQIKEVSCYEFPMCNFKLKYYKVCQKLLNLLGEQRFKEVMMEVQAITEKQLKFQPDLLRCQLQVIQNQLINF